MKKQIFFLAVAALALASCSSENDVVQSPAVQQTTTDEVAVDFDVYASRGTTRAGKPGEITTTSIKTGDHKNAGFGVFGYYTDGENYSGITKPNFFYNQQVYWTGTAADPIPSNVWYYTPLKYWPNEFGSDAISDQVDRVTFFAYAPYVEVNPLTGIVTSSEAGAKVQNITSMTRNNVTGDPYIKYTCSMDATNSVDLLYGVAAEDFTSSNSSVNQNDIKKGRPYLDVVKPGLGDNGKIKFDFKHALAQMKVTVDAVVNTATQGGTNDIQSDYTRIWVRSVTFEGITLSGALNLNSIAPTPEWYDTNGNSKITTGSITVYDGRKDGKEALLEATNENPAMLNPNLVQNVAYKFDTNDKIDDNEVDPGVTKTERNLFKCSNDVAAIPEAIFCIPTGEKMKVTIVYDVETVDKNLAFYLSDGATQGSSIQNSITKTIDAFGEIKAGYCYNLKLHLGMRTVDFDATVTDWQNITAEADLPSNLQTFALDNPNDMKTINLPAVPDNFDFAVSGLAPNVKPTITNGLSTITLTAEQANASGVAIIHATSITPNTTTSKKTYTSARISSATKYVDLKFALAPAPINFTALSATANLITCVWDGTLTDVTFASSFNDLVSSGKGYIKVFKNGVEITNATGVVFKNDAKTIEIPAALTLQNGDVITVELKANDAPVESRTITVSI